MQIEYLANLSKPRVEKEGGGQIGAFNTAEIGRI